MAYSSTFLAYGTVLNPGPNCDEYEVAGGFHTINFNDLFYTPISTSTFSKAGCPAIVNPRVSLPADLTNVAPSWTNCEPLFYGAYDPPSFLKKASRLGPVQVGGGSITVAGSAVATTVPAMAEAAQTPGLPQPTAKMSPPQNDPQDAVVPDQTRLGSAPSAQASPSSGNAGNDPQTVPGNEFAGPLSSPPAAPANAAASTESESHIPANPAVMAEIKAPTAPVKPVPVPSGNPQEAPTKSPAASTQTQVNPNGAPKEGSEGVPAESPSKPQAIPNTLPQGGDRGSPAVAPEYQAPDKPSPNNQAPDSQAPGRQALPEADSNTVTNNNPDPASAASNNRAQSHANANAIQNNEQSAASVDPVQTQGIPYDPQEGGFDPAPVISIQPAAATVAAAPVTPEDQQAKQKIPEQPDPGTPPGSDQNVPHHSPGNTPNGNKQNIPSEPEDNIVPSVNLKVPQIEPVPLVVGPDGDVLVDNGSQNPPEAGAVLHTAPAATAVAPTQQANGAAPSVVSMDNAGSIYSTLSQADKNVPTPPFVSVGNNGKTYAAPLKVGAHPVAKPALPLSIGGQAVRIAPNGAVHVIGQIVTQGGQTTISGTLLSVGNSNIVIGSSTLVLPIDTASVPTQGPLMIGGSRVRIASNGGLVVASKTISQGSQTIIAGVAISIGAGSVVIDGTTHAFDPTGIALPTASSDEEVVLTRGEVVTEGGTLITHSGPIVSASVDGSGIMVGTATMSLGALMTGAVTPSALGGLILSALGTGPDSTAANSTPSSDTDLHPSDKAIQPSPFVGASSREWSTVWTSNGIMRLAYVLAVGMIGLVII